MIDSNFKFSNTNREEVLKIINNFLPKTSTGCDELSMKLLKRIKLIVCDPLALIINQSFNTGIFPEQLKLAKVLPLFKKDDKTISNFANCHCVPIVHLRIAQMLKCSP